MRIFGETNRKHRKPLGCDGTLAAFWIPVLLLTIAFVLVGPSQAADPENLSDRDITDAVERELRTDMAVSTNLIDVQTEDGIVTLTGTMDSLLAKEQAVRIAESIKGVRAVVNNLKVRLIARSDYQIQRDIINALRYDPATESYEIIVRVVNGIATLSGQVDSWAEKQLAGRVAKAIRGLKDLENQISVEYTAERSDAEIKEDVQGRLAADIYVDEALMDVVVTEGKVILKGVAGSAAEKSRALRDAWVAGVRSVDASGLEVKWWARDEMRKTRQIPLEADAGIKKAVESALLDDPRISLFDTQVEVDKRVVTLRGVVDNLKAKRSAERDARNTAGVLRVKNRIKVRTAEPPSDADIEEAIRHAFQQDIKLDRYEFTVVVVNREAFLYGTVDSHYEKTRAEDVASRVVGVSEVANYITVSRVWEWKSDSVIKADVEDELFWSPFVDSEDITVKVKDGDVTLRGVATDWAEADAAVANAFEGGARSVRAGLVLADGSEYSRYYAHDYDFYRYDHFY